MPPHDRSRVDAVTIGSPKRIARATEDTPTIPLPTVSEDTPTLPLPRVERSTQDISTLPLKPVELDAVMQGASAASTPPGLASATPTVEYVRLAQGSSPIPPTERSERGPRRPRETLRADKIRLDPDEPTPPSRKR